MVEYFKSKNGYFYKLLKNGQRTRISQDEYKRKTLRSGRRMRGGNEPILDEDIMYQDGLVCILKPDVKKGIVVWTNYTQPMDAPSLCSSGLKTGKRLQEEGVSFGRSVYHPYIFFRAPYYANEMDYSTIETEIRSSYGEGQQNQPRRAYIRVHPDKTFVFSSEIRARFLPPFYYGTPAYHNAMENAVNNSKKSLTEYLRILKNNETIPVPTGKIAMYNLFTSTKSTFSSQYPLPSYPMDIQPIERHSEILVSLSHLTPDYFVYCSN